MARRALLGTRTFQGGQAVELLPELDGIAKNSGDHVAQPGVLFGQDKGKAARFEALLVAGEDRFAGVFGGDLQARFANGDVRAGGQAHQIDGVGQSRKLRRNR